MGAGVGLTVGTGVGSGVGIGVGVGAIVTMGVGAGEGVGVGGLLPQPFKQKSNVQSNKINPCFFIIIPSFVMFSSIIGCVSKQNKENIINM